MGRRPVAAQRILSALLATPTQDRYGLELIEATGLRSGSLYPALANLEDNGWVTSTWEQENPSDLGRPRRRLYRLTPDGLAAAIEFDRAPETLRAGIPRLTFGGTP